MAAVSKSLTNPQKLDLVKAAGPVDTKQIAAEIKGSLYQSVGWETLLMSAPISIGSLGACFVASSSSKIQSIEVQLVGKVRVTSLRANLVDCANIGRKAFSTAHVSMGSINNKSTRIQDDLRQMVMTLVDEEAPKEVLQTHMMSLKNGTGSCLRDAIEISKKFEEWLDFIMDLHTACDQKRTDTAREAEKAKIGIQVESTRLDYQKITTDKADEANKRMAQQMDVTLAAYKDAADNFPSGWDIVGQKIVGGLAETFTHIMNTAVTVVADYVSPMRKARMVANIASDAVGDFKNLIDSDDDEEAAPADSAGQPKPRQKKRRSGAQQTLTDPAYTHVSSTIPQLEIMLEVLKTGPGGGVNWDKAISDPDAEDSRRTAVYLKRVLAGAKDAFALLAAQSEPSREYTGVLTAATQIAADLEKEVDKSKKMGFKALKADSAEVKAWQESFDAAYARAVKLYSTAKSLPGSSPNGYMALEEPEMSSDPSDSVAILEGATNRLNITREAYIATQQNYVTSTGMLIEAQNRMTEIQANIKKLQSTSMNLEEVQGVLEECIELVASVKTDIDNLVIFFKTFSNAIETVVEFQVSKFLSLISANVKAGDPENPLIGAMSWSSSQKQIIFQMVVTMNAYISVYGDIARMWVDLSGRHIRPGLALLDQLSSVKDKGPGALQEKGTALSEWSREASEAVKQMALEFFQKTEDEMLQRVQKISAVTEQIGARPAITEAIIKGREEATKNTAVVLAEKTVLAKRSAAAAVEKAVAPKPAADRLKFMF